MASCSGITNGPHSLEPDQIKRIAAELYKCVRNENLVKAKIILKGLKKYERQKVTRETIEGNTPLFLAAQQGHVYFVNFLLDEGHSDIEQRGVYEVMDDRSRHKVTPLWCAAVANKVEVVKTLIKHFAEVNATSDTQSTPVRSACYMTNIEVVRVLTENGADIHKPNVNGGTCLINSVQSVELCKYLIEKNADVNSRDNSGNLALHYAIREGRMETVKLLMKHGSDPYLKNDFQDDALQTASLRGYADILDFLVSKIKPPMERQIEAYELMATNFVDEKHDLQRAIEIWKSAMALRYQDPNNVYQKTGLLVPHSAYQMIQEARNMEELKEITSSPDAMYMQALIIRERILKEDHKDTIFGLMYRGAVYADTHRYQRCVDLWKYAFELRHRKLEPLNHECLFTLQALCKLFWEIHEEFQAGYTDEQVQTSDVRHVFEMALQQVILSHKVLQTRPVNLPQIEEFHSLLLLILHLLHLLHSLPSFDESDMALRRALHSVVRLDPRGLQGRPLLQLAVDRKSCSVQEEYYSPLPSIGVVHLLLGCGAAINAVDDDGNTVLHVCAGNLQLDSATMQVLQDVVECLIHEGAHVDACNANGLIAIKYLTQNPALAKLRVSNFLSLKCLAARVIRQTSIPYESEVPSSLIPFLEMH